MRKNFVNSLVLILVLVFAISGGVLGYTYSNPSYTSYSSSGVLGSFTTSSLKVDSSMCTSGQDFILQIEPLSCEPAVVRSDLLEENDVTVYCKIVATQVNPLVDINAIKYISMSGDYPSEIKSIGYVPSDAALGNYNYDLDLNSPAFNNLGYVAITLRQNSNESSMPQYVLGNLTAKLTYDVENAFGVGNAEFYLPVLSDSDFENRISQYSFWQGRGYIRANNVNDGSASISLYSTDGRKVSQVSLDEGQTSGELSLPGLSSCLATLKFRLNDIVDADTKARLRVNAEYVEVGKGESFLDGKCTVNDVKKDGLNQNVKIYCEEDDSKKSFYLKITPSVNINVNGKVGEYKLGDKIYTSADNSNAVYLGYIGTKGDTTNLKDLFVVLVASPEQNTKLTDSEISSISSQMNLIYSNVDSGASAGDVLVNGLSAFGGNLISFVKWSVSGETTKVLEFSGSTGVANKEDFWGVSISLSGLSQAQDVGSVSIKEETYDLSKTIFGTGIGSSDAYEIKQDGTSKNAYLVWSEEGVGNPSLYFKVPLLTGYSPTLATFSGDSCTSNTNCAGYTLLDSGLIGVSSLDWFYSDLVSAKVQKASDGSYKLILKKLVYDSNSDEDYYRYYKNSLSDYETIQNSFSTQISSSGSETYGEKALYNAIILSEKLGQRKTMSELCRTFEENYPDSSYELNSCEDEFAMSNTEISSRDVLINNKIKEISFSGVYLPSYEDYGAEITVRGPNGKAQSFQLKKDGTVYFEGFRDSKSLSLESVQLISVDSDSAKVKINVNGEGTFKKLFSTNTYSLDMNSPESFGSQYTFTLTNTNVKKYAKVTVVPSFNYQDSTSNFPFKIGIEKRSIQLSDSKIQSKINSLNNSITTWEKLSDNLHTLNTYLGDACVITGGWLTVKNFLQNSDGKSIARQKVMTESGGWNDYCQTEVSKGNYVSLDDCFFKNSDKIDARVDVVANQISKQNTEIQNIQSSYTTDTVLGKKVNDEAFAGSYSETVASSLNGFGGTISDPNGKLGNINLDEMKSSVLVAEGYGSYYTIDELKEIELYSKLSQSATDADSKAFYQKQLYSVLYDVKKNSEQQVVVNSFKSETGISDSSAVLNLNSNVKITYLPVTKYATFSESVYKNYLFGTDTPIVQSDYVYAIRDEANGGQKYLLVYDSDGVILRTYTINSAGTLSLYRDDKGNVKNNPFSLSIKKYDTSTYKNNYLNPELRYYEIEPYKGNPALVPLDPQEGWYVATRPTAFDTSGKVESIYLCNVGENGLEQFDVSGYGDDICGLINLGTNQPYDQFAGLSSSEATKLVVGAVGSSTGGTLGTKGVIEQAQKAYSNGVKKVRITYNGKTNTYDVGNPAVDTPSALCTDFMSPDDCKLLFNVCDPVVCPSSRCDFGGNYPVKDVVQSGIVGSIALCAPNYREGIKIPICTTGVEGGVNNWISVQESYRDCLQENLDSGKTVGICDKIHSVYACEFFWKQAIPLAKITLPKALNAAAGQNSRGGGEYLTFQNSLTNAKDSLTYFEQSYASEAYNAFKLRSVDEAGTTVCKLSASVIFPTGADLVDSITSPRSPPQFTGSFSEESLTTITNPPTSHYKVFYHIYAGEDSGAYYQVYLKGGASSSYYQDTSMNLVVASGYANAGDYASETRDIQAPSGYTTLCLVVNGQEECGFSKASTSFAVNYVNDLYLEQQATEKVKTEKDCVSGTASIYSLLNPNSQDIVNSLIDPAIYQKGITRTCATESPGKGTDGSWDDPKNARWRDVGYCDNTNVRCWVDTDSVKKAIKSLDLEKEALDETGQSYVDTILSSGKYLSNEQFAANLTGINSETDNLKKITMINSVLDKVFFSNQKAQLYMLRGVSYGNLAENAYALIKDTKTLTAEDTGQVDNTGATIYTFNDGETKIVYYRYFNGKWQWSFDQVDWKETSNTDGVSIINQQIISELAKMNEIDGKALIEFEMDILGGSVNGCDSSVGNKILSVAKLKIGQDTTRIVKGSEVYDRVCATFVSNVLIDVGVLPQFADCKIDSIPERDAVTELNTLFKTQSGFKEIGRDEWASGLKAGDVIIWGCKGADCTANTGVEFQHITIFESYDNGGAKIIHDGGKDVKISEKTYPNIFGTTWYVTHVWRAGCSGSIIKDQKEIIDSLNSYQKDVYSSASVCEDCSIKKYFDSATPTSVCDENLCSAIGKKISLDCTFAKDKNGEATCTSKFTAAELNAIKTATKCSNCGNDLHWYTASFGNRCSRDECEAIGTVHDLICIYKDAVVTGNCEEVSTAGISSDVVKGVIHYRSNFYTASYVLVDNRTYASYMIDLVDVKFVKSADDKILYSSKEKTSDKLGGDWDVVSDTETLVYNSKKDSYSSEIKINHNKGAGLKSSVTVDVNTYRQLKYNNVDTKFVVSGSQLYYSTDGGNNWYFADSDMADFYLKNK